MDQWAGRTSEPNGERHDNKIISGSRVGCIENSCIGGFYSCLQLHEASKIPEVETPI